MLVILAEDFRRPGTTMAPRSPVSDLPTHRVFNQPPILENYDLLSTDPCLHASLLREGAPWSLPMVEALGQVLGCEDVLELGHRANRHLPELRSFDRLGHRIDEVVFDPSYHELMALGFSRRLPTIAWTAPQAGGHVAHAAMTLMFIQVEAGVACPFAMAYAAVPVLRQQPGIFDDWVSGLLSTDYDQRFLPITEKRGLTIGMAMTEKQGGSDVRANSTRAEAVSESGSGQEYRLVGHKWFCSAPMSDGFLTLAQTQPEGQGGPTCFLVPRWLPDGQRNAIVIQRLKDKLGNRANASAEIEYHGAWAQRVGEEGAGVRTIIEMVHHTRLDCAIAAAALMRQAVVQAIHHAAHRRAFGSLLIEQPLMRNVLADLALESEAATTLVMRVARAFDQGQHDPAAKLFARVAVAVAKYWLNKRVCQHVYEAMESLGGAGYVEESILPRLYREAPLNSIWEGAGNVICLDVLRAFRRQPECLELLLAELEQARGGARRLDQAIDRLKDDLLRAEEQELRARRLVESLAISLQGALLLRHAPTAVADAFIASRLSERPMHCYGTLPERLDVSAIIERAWPQID